MAQKGESHYSCGKDLSGPAWGSVTLGTTEAGGGGQGHPRQLPDSPAVCNASTCPQSPPACGLGEKLVRTHPPLGDLSNPGIESVSLTSPALAGTFFTASAPWEAHNNDNSNNNSHPLTVYCEISTEILYM